MWSERVQNSLVHTGKASVLETIVHDSAHHVDFWLCVCAERTIYSSLLK